MNFLNRKNILLLALIALGLAVFIFADNRRPSTSKTVATGNPLVIDSIQKKCQSSSLGKETCYSKEFRTLAKAEGAVAAFKTLHQLQTVDPEAQGCHLIAHGIGWGTFERDPNAWQSDIQTMEPSCSYGAIHGVIEGYLATQPAHTLNAQVIPKICGEAPRADCNHIVGHLILVETKADVDAGLALCDVFKQDEVQLMHCYTGVFMEYQTALNLIDHGLAPREWLNWPARVPELEKMCRTYSGDKAIACWKEIVHAALVKFHNDPKTIFDFCSTAQVPEGAAECKRHSIGIIAAAYNFDLPSLKYMCDLKQTGDSDFKADCYNMLEASTLSTLPDEKEEVTQFCESLNEAYQQACLAQVQYSNFNRND